MDRHVVQPQKEQLLNRLRRIEGQVRGVARMIEEDRYCIDILHQISAIQSAMKQVALALLEDHTRHCVMSAIKNGDESEAISELMEVVRQYVK